MADRRDTLRRRYLSLGCGELSAGVAVALLLIVLDETYPSIGDPRGVLWLAAVPLLAVLAQAGAYWLLAREWVMRGPMPLVVAGFYWAFRILDVLVIAGVGIVLTLHPPASVTGVAIAASLWILAIVEYVNYFVARLAYPLGSWWSGVNRWATPTLVKDLRMRL